MPDPITLESIIIGIALGTLNGGVSWLLIKEMSDRLALTITLSASLLIHAFAGVSWMAQHGVDTTPVAGALIASWLTASLLSVSSLCVLRFTRL